MDRTDTDRLAALLHADFMAVLPTHQRYPAPCSVCEGRAARLITAGVTLAPTPPDALDVERQIAALEWDGCGGIGCPEDKAELYEQVVAIVRAALEPKP